MRPLVQTILFVALALEMASATYSQTPARGADSFTVPPAMVMVPAGVFRPPFRIATQPAKIPVAAFLLDVLPVTNEEFLRFVRDHPEWRRSRVERRFADTNYLSDWAGDLDHGGALSNAPVTHVSWFAARAFANWSSKRLPKLAEWELAAAASASHPDATREPEFQARILRWYSTPASDRTPAVGGSPANYFGVRNLHGLVWEWVADFDVPWAGAAMMGSERDKICGAGAVGASDPGAYATFMRYGFRSSLQADYCVSSLGFRCARTAKPASP